MAAFTWEPDRVWRLTLSEVLRYLAALKRVEIQRAFLVSKVLTLPLLKRADQAREIAQLKLASGERPLTIEEEYGPKIAAEVAELDRRNKEWLAQQRKAAQ